MLKTHTPNFTHIGQEIWKRASINLLQQLTFQNAGLRLTGPQVVFRGPQPHK
jgi:hypothetical protein